MNERILFPIGAALLALFLAAGPTFAADRGAGIHPGPPGALPDETFCALCRGGATAQVEQALKDGANPDARESGEPRWTALMLAADRDDLPLVRVLLAAGAKVDAQSDDGETALVRAASESGTVVRALLDAGADVKLRLKSGASQGATALAAAVLSGRVETVAALLAAGADKKDRVQGKDAMGWVEIRRQNIAYMQGDKAQNEADTERIVRLLQGGGGKKPAAKRKR